MTTITIPKELTQGRELVLLPRKEYEEFLRYRLRTIKEVRMTPAQKRALARARRNIARGKFLSVHELKHKLGSKS